MKTNMLTIILLSFSLSISISSHADSNSKFDQIEHHWQMIMMEKNSKNRSQMLKEHESMLMNFEKSENMHGQHNGMKGNHMGGMSGNHMHMMNTMDMHRSIMDMMK